MNTQELFQLAKDDLLASGDHPPMLYVEFVDVAGEECVDVIYLANFGRGTYIEECKDFFRLGAKFGESDARVEFTRMSFISETWVSFVKPGEKRAFQRPEDDPHRREGLMAQILEFHPTPDGKPALKQLVLTAEVVRPMPNVIDLVEGTNIEITQRMLFPMYFLSGYASTQIPQEEFAAIVSKYGNKR